MPQKRKILNLFLFNPKNRRNSFLAHKTVKINIFPFFVFCKGIEEGICVVFITHISLVFLAF